MMDVVKVFTAIKGKVLDVLKTPYKLQNQNIEQLKNNNAAFKESNTLLEEKVISLKRENQNLNQRLNECKSELNRISINNSNEKLSKKAEAILLQCRKQGCKQFSDEGMMRTLSLSNLEISSAIDELWKAKLIEKQIRFAPSFAHPRGTIWHLTSRGKKLALEMNAVV